MRSNAKKVTLKVWFSSPLIDYSNAWPKFPIFVGPIDQAALPYGRAAIGYPVPIVKEVPQGFGSYILHDPFPGERARVKKGGCSRVCR